MHPYRALDQANPRAPAVDHWFRWWTCCSNSCYIETSCEMLAL